jgi:hypothetical protein
VRDFGPLPPGFESFDDGEYRTDYHSTPHPALILEQESLEVSSHYRQSSWRVEAADRSFSFRLPSGFDCDGMSLTDGAVRFPFKSTYGSGALEVRPETQQCRITGDMVTGWGPLSDSYELIDRATMPKRPAEPALMEGSSLITGHDEAEESADAEPVDDLHISTRSTAHPAIMIRESRWELSMTSYDKFEHVVEASTGDTLFPLPRGQWMDTLSADGSALCLVRQDRSLKRWFEYQPKTKLCRVAGVSPSPWVPLSHSKILLDLLDNPSPSDNERIPVAATASRPERPSPTGVQLAWMDVGRAAAGLLMIALLLWRIFG